jgi:hypothetical protein
MLDRKHLKHFGKRLEMRLCRFRQECGMPDEKYAPYLDGKLVTEQEIRARYLRETVNNKRVK